MKQNLQILGAILGMILTGAVLFQIMSLIGAKIRHLFKILKHLLQKNRINL